MIDKDAVKTSVLTENTAQAVLNHLQELESNRARLQKRWIWELLQNARDSSLDEDTKLVASIQLADDSLVFEHNGRGFTIDEVAHLIYHGSTKAEDESAIGQYGSGFLTTHLLSPEIDISGHLDIGSQFNFRLKRKLSSVAELSDSMDRAWTGFDESTADVSHGFTTRFRYPLQDDSKEAVEEGLADLKRCASFVVVFNRQFHRIVIESTNRTTSFEVIDRVLSPQDGIVIVTVGVDGHGTPKQQKFLLAEGEQVSVTVPVDANHNGSSCVPLEDIPRLFLGFPLVGTETFSFPAVINSFAFTPTENRDGVYLGQSKNAANETNKSAIEEACDLHLKLVDYAANERWRHTYRLADVPPITEQTWLNSAWLDRRLEQFVSQIRETPAVYTEHRPLAPNESVLPVADKPGDVEALWDLMHEVKEFRQKLPERPEAVGWRSAVDSWASVLHCEPESFDEVCDGSRLASFLESKTSGSDSDYGTLEQLEHTLQENVDSVRWLDEFYRVLKSDRLDGVMRECHVVLDQAGYLDKLPNLYRDNGIDNELKEICDEILELGIRARLRDPRLTSLADEIGKGERSNEEVVQYILNRLQELSHQEDLGTDFIQASPRLLAWLIANQQWTRLSDYPAFSRKTGDGRCELLRLVQLRDDQTEVALAPIRAWAPSLQPYADLFPTQHTMADDFFAVMPDATVWQMITSEGYVRTDVVFTGNKTLADFIPDEPLPEPRDEHRTVDAVAVTDVAFLAKDRIGVMARVRDSQTRARLFWRFLTEWLIDRDPEGLVPELTNCECGESHRFFQSSWLIPVVRNNWVPQGNDIRDRVTAQSLANLLRESDWTVDSLTDSPASDNLLRAIGVTQFDLMRHLLVSDDESRSALDDTMTSILVSTGGDLGHVSSFVEDLKTDKDLPQHLADRRERRRIVHENQRLGGLVEELVKEGLEDEGFTVRRTGIGSDFEIEYDLIEDDQEMGIELARDDRIWLVEVKATRDHRVRMTARQAETARDEGEGFLLCVVPVGDPEIELAKDDVRANMRFVKDIGPRVGPLFGELNALNEMRDDAIAPRDSDIQLEIEAGAARIRVENTVWQNGLHLGSLSAQLK